MPFWKIPFLRWLGVAMALLVGGLELLALQRARWTRYLLTHRSA